MGTLRTYQLGRVFSCFYEDFSVKVGSPFSTLRNGNANFSRYSLQAAALNNETFCTFCLTPGNYNFTVLCGTTSAGGIITVKIDGTTVLTIDSYSATSSFAVSRTFPYTVSSHAPHILSMTTTSKNVASTGYDFFCTRVSAKLT